MISSDFDKDLRSEGEEFVELQERLLSLRDADLERALLVSISDWIAGAQKWTEFVLPKFVQYLDNEIRMNYNSTALEIFMCISASKLKPQLLQTLCRCAFWSMWTTMPMDKQLQVCDIALNLKLNGMSDEQQRAVADCVLQSGEPERVYRLVRRFHSFTNYDLETIFAKCRDMINSAESAQEDKATGFYIIYELLVSDTWESISQSSWFCEMCNSALTTRDPTLCASVFSCISRIAELSSQPENLSGFDLSLIVDLVLSNRDDARFANMRFHGLTLLINASCIGYREFLYSNKDFMDALYDMITNGNYRDRMRSIQLYNNLIDRKDLEKRLEMTTNEMMHAVIQQIAEVPRKRLTRDVINMLWKTYEKLEGSDRERLLLFIHQHIRELQVIQDEHESEMIQFQLRTWLEAETV